MKYNTLSSERVSLDGGDEDQSDGPDLACLLLDDEKRRRLQYGCIAGCNVLRAEANRLAIDSLAKTGAGKRGIMNGTSRSVSRSEG